MTTSLQRLIALLMALCLVFILTQPGLVVADDDDDDWDDDDIYETSGDDDDDFDDDDIPVAPPVQAPASDDEDDWDDDLDDYGLDEDDSPISSRAIVQLAPGVDMDIFAARYGAEVIRSIPGGNIALLGIGNPVASGPSGVSTLFQDDDDDLDNDDLDDDDDDFDDDGVDDDDRIAQPVMDDDFYNRYTIADDRRATVTSMVNDPDVIWVEFNFTSRAPEGRPRYFFTSSVGEPQVVEAPALPSGLELESDAVCTTGASVVVAVLDTGIDAEHPALAGNVMDTGVNMLETSWDVNDTGNGVDDDGDGLIDEMVGHGTHISGTILQVAPDAQILPVKVLDSDGSGDTFSVMAGIIYAMEQNVDVINLSLGSTWNSAAIAYAIGEAEAQGIVVVAAAGNGNRSTPVEFPASHPGVISVAATNADSDKAEYSNYNEHVDISAPGDNIASAYPGGLYTTASGTSMSAPVISGSAALMLERSPQMSPQSIRDRIFSTASPLNLSDPTMDGMLGGGEIDIDATLVCGG